MLSVLMLVISFPPGATLVKVMVLKDNHQFCIHITDPQEIPKESQSKQKGSDSVEGEQSESGQ